VTAIRHAAGVDAFLPAGASAARKAGSLIDTLLDRSIAGGYTNVGYLARRPLWNAADLAPMTGRVALVTGAAAGLGLAAALGLARLGASVRLLVRSKERGEAARAQVSAVATGGYVAVDACDLSDLSDVRRYAAELSASVPRLDVLVNNAGVMTHARTLSPDGIELTFATNVLGPFLLTELLVALLRAGAPSRVINVSSGGMYAQRLTVEDLQTARGDFDGAAAYARTKRAQVVLSELWAQRLAGTGIVVHAMHPGWVDTPGLRDSLPRFHALVRPFLRTPEQGADTIVWLAAADLPARCSGRFWHDRRARPTHLVPWTRESAADRERLWAECERLSGADANAPATSITPES